MKATIDSGELQKAISIASRFTRSSSVEISEAMLLTVGSDGLYVRTTSFDTNCVIRVNAFSAEDGAAVVLAKNLLAVTYDSGGMVEIRTTPKQLHLKYGTTNLRISRRIEGPEDFPTWQETSDKILIHKKSLLVACSQTIPESKSPPPIVSSIHLVPRDNNLIIFGVDGVSGALSTIMDSSPPSMVSISSSMVKAAVAIMDDDVYLSYGKSCVGIDSYDSSKRVLFVTTSIQGGLRVADLIDQLFLAEVAGDEAVIDQETMQAIVNVCNAAVRIDELSEVSLESDGKNLLVCLAGDGIEGTSDFQIDGVLPYVTFLCKTIVSTLQALRDSDEYKISAMPHPQLDTIARIRIEGVDIHVVACAHSGRLGRETKS